MVEAIVLATATPDWARPENIPPNVLLPKLAAPVPSLPKPAAPTLTQLEGPPAAAADDAAACPVGTYGAVCGGGE